MGKEARGDQENEFQRNVYLRADANAPTPWGVSARGVCAHRGVFKPDKSLFWFSDSDSTGSIYPQRVSIRRGFLNF